MLLRMRTSCIPIIVLLLSGCADGPTRDSVIADVRDRSGFTMPSETEAGKLALPPVASLEDGLTEDEAVSIALWNNAAFQETLVSLDMARGDLIQAGLLPNPIGTYAFSTPDKPFKYAFEFPLEALWLRPFRVRAARADAERVSHQLSQAGLNVIRDTRRAYSDLLQARTQFRLLKESLALRRNISGLARKRNEAGDISTQEANIAALDAMAAEQAATRGQYDIQANEERLRFAMGLGDHAMGIKLDPMPTPDCKKMDVAALIDEGLRNRPDALAARQATTAAEERANQSFFNWLGVTVIADATSGRTTGHELSPAARGSIPVFNVNQGNITRAGAETERAARGEVTMANQIRLDVNQAYVLYRQACSELSILQRKVKAEVKTDLSRVGNAYSSGDVPYLMVLQSTRAVIDTLLREAQLIGDARRAFSDLERSVGRRLDSVTAPAGGTQRHAEQ